MRDAGLRHRPSSLRCSDLRRQRVATRPTVDADGPCDVRDCTSTPTRFTMNRRTFLTHSTALLAASPCRRAARRRARHRVARVRPLRRLARQPRHLELGRRDPRRLHRRCAEDRRHDAPPHRPLGGRTPRAVALAGRGAHVAARGTRGAAAACRARASHGHRRAPSAAGTPDPRRSNRLHCARPRVDLPRGARHRRRVALREYRPGTDVAGTLRGAGLRHAGTRSPHRLPRARAS